ncbi:MAG: nucleotidyltransferase domain-containing protein [Zetaproteobacteria bacterium]|nr:MAG: nucleotidyltransferase domain-containing protein [Zetaproteobacteria bacterium]
METTNAPIDDACARIRRILDRHPTIRLALLFGSLARGTARPESDLDLAVEGRQPLSTSEKMALIRDLAGAFGRPVDLIDLTTAGEPPLGQILSCGIRIVGSNRDYARLISRHLLEQEDFMPYRQRIIEARRRAWIGQ